MVKFYRLELVNNSVIKIMSTDKKAKLKDTPLIEVIAVFSDPEIMT